MAEVAGTECYDDVLILYMVSNEDGEDMMAALEDKTGVVGGVLKVLECDNYVYNPDGSIGERECQGRGGKIVDVDDDDDDGDSYHCRVPLPCALRHFLTFIKV